MYEQDQSASAPSSTVAHGVPVMHSNVAVAINTVPDCATSGWINFEGTLSYFSKFLNSLLCFESFVLRTG